MRQLKKVITFIFLVLISIELAGCFYKPEIRVVSEVTAEEADAIQEEFALSCQKRHKLFNADMRIQR